MPLNDILAYSGGGLFILLTLIEISPLKINPWKWIGKVLGKVFSQDVLDKIDELKNAQEKYQEDNDKRMDKLEKSHKDFQYQYLEDAAKAARRRILCSADELRLGIEHSHEWFNDVLNDVSFYNNFCLTHEEFKNMQAVAAIAFITEKYQHCLEENKFL